MSSASGAKRTESWLADPRPKSNPLAAGRWRLFAPLNYHGERRTAKLGQSQCIQMMGGISPEAAVIFYNSAPYAFDGFIFADRDALHACPHAHWVAGFSAITWDFTIGTIPKTILFQKRKRYLAEEGNLTPFFLIPILFIGILSAIWFCRSESWRLFFVQAGACALSFYAHVFFGRQRISRGGVLPAAFFVVQENARTPFRSSSPCGQKLCSD